MEWFDRAQEQIEKEYDEGDISYSELKEAMSDLQEEYNQARQNAAEEAYNNY